MSAATDHEIEPASNESAAKPQKKSRTEIYVFGLIGAGVVILVLYQFFGCSACYH